MAGRLFPRGSRASGQLAVALEESRVLGEAANILTFLMPVILPVAGMVLIGRALVHIGFLDDPAVRGLSNLVFWLLLPSFLFLSVYKNPIPNAGETIGLYFSIALPAYAVSAAVGRRLLRLTMAQSGVLALNAIYGNSVLLGIPIVGTVWGGPGLNVLLAIVAVHSLLLLPIASAMVEVGERLENPIVGPILSALKNPIVTSILVAVVVRWIEIPIPTAVSRTLELLGQGAPSLSLLCLGATLPPFRRHAFQASVATALVIKLALLPIAMAGAV